MIFSAVISWPPCWMISHNSVLQQGDHFLTLMYFRFLFLCRHIGCIITLCSSNMLVFFYISLSLECTHPNYELIIINNWYYCYLFFHWSWINQKIHPEWDAWPRRLVHLTTQEKNTHYLSVSVTFYCSEINYSTIPLTGEQIRSRRRTEWHNVALSPPGFWSNYTGHYNKNEQDQQCSV